MRRKRKHISLEQRLASALSMLLSQEQRDEMRARKALPREVIRLFTYDHAILHALGGADAWHNLTPVLRGPVLKAKDGRDTSAVAKVRRIEPAWKDFTKRMASKRPGQGARPKSKWRKRKTAWPKRSLTKTS